jgi:hypothetical protein
MFSIRRISLGGGFRYLMDSVAAGDGGPEQSNNLTRYYAESGTPPGVFVGAGLADLADGKSVENWSEVTEEHPVNMLGACADPITGEPLGSTPPTGTRQAPVAGFDLTFSPSKSTSTAWALADEGIKGVIYECHRRAIDYVLTYAEREVFHSRSGHAGVVQEDIIGVVATAFTHWDSPAGDPQPASRPRGGGEPGQERVGRAVADTGQPGPLQVGHHARRDAPGGPLRLPDRCPGRRVGRPQATPHRHAPMGDRRCSQSAHARVLPTGRTDRQTIGRPTRAFESTRVGKQPWLKRCR